MTPPPTPPIPTDIYTAVFNLSFYAAGSNTAPEARRQCKAAVRRLLSFRPRARILFPVAGTGLLLVNTSAGDRCIRFHETAALRRISRTRLDLPPVPRSALTDGQGLFDAAEIFDDMGRNSATLKEGEARGKENRSGNVRMIGGTTECSLVDVVFLPEYSTLLGLIGGRAEVSNC